MNYFHKHSQHCLTQKAIAPDQFTPSVIDISTTHNTDICVRTDNTLEFIYEYISNFNDDAVTNSAQVTEAISSTNNHLSKYIKNSIVFGKQEATKQLICQVVFQKNYYEKLTP